jgi:hydroxymethylpyrimidine pyrophosphatase-like HAD family hydrolase
VTPIREDRRRPAPLRGLYTDLDGTLLGPGGSLFATSRGPSARTAQAVARLHEEGVALVPVSGRTRDQLREAARILGAEAFIAELGAYVVQRSADGREETIPNLGAFRGRGTPVEAMARSGAGGFLLERYAGSLEPHAPWAFAGREATMLLRGLIDPVEASAALAGAGYDWLEVVDNGRLSRRYEPLDLPEFRAYHLVPRGVSKASGVRLHMGRAGWDPAECAAVGDSPSDLVLAEVVGRVFLVAAGATGDRENVTVTSSPDGEGFVEAVDDLLGSPAS